MMKDIAEIESIFNEFLPWNDPEQEGVYTELSSVRQVGDKIQVGERIAGPVETEDGGIMIAVGGAIKYLYDPSTDILEPTHFSAGPWAGEGMLTRHTAACIGIFLENFPVLRCRTNDPAVVAVYEAHGCFRDPDDPTLWTVTPDELEIRPPTE